MGETNLKETIAAGERETRETPSQEAIVTPEEVSTQGEETNAGDPSSPEYISGIDISDIPAQDRPRIKQLLEKKANLLERGYNQKFQEVAKFKKAQEELISAGLSVEEAQQVLQTHLETKRNPSKATKEEKRVGKLIDNLLESSIPAEQKESLRQLRIIAQEEAAESPAITSLMQKIDSLEKTVRQLQGNSFSSAQEKASSDLNALKTKLGNNVVAKYSEEILSEWKKYPNSLVKDIAKYVIPDEEYEQALLSNRKPNKPQTEKLNAITSPGTSVSSTKEVVNPKMPLKGVIREAFSSKK